MILFDYTWLQKAVASGSAITECQGDWVKINQTICENYTRKWGKMGGVIINERNLNL